MTMTEPDLEVVDELAVPDLVDQPETSMAVEVHRPAAMIPGQSIPIIPQHAEMQGLAAMAVTLAAAEAVPAALRNKPNDVFQILLTARDLGIAVTTGIRELHVIDGKVTVSPKLKLAMVNERGRVEGWAVWPDPANDAVRAVWHATRRDRPGVAFSYEFTMAEAKNAGTGKGTGKLAEKDNWKNYPKRMLSWRALGYLLDDTFPEVGTGLYSPDEMGAMTDEEGHVIDVASTEALPGTKAPRGHGPQPPAEGDQLWSEIDLAEFEALHLRVQRLVATAPDAAAELSRLWRDSANPLPPIAELSKRQSIRAKALVTGIENRVRKGDEWGPEAKAAFEAGTVTPEGDERAPTAASDAPTVPGGGDSPESGEATTAPPWDMPSTPPSRFEEVAEMAEGEVIEALFDPTDGLWLDEYGDPPSDLPAQRRALASLLHHESVEAAVRAADEAMSVARQARRDADDE